MPLAFLYVRHSIKSQYEDVSTLLGVGIIIGSTLHVAIQCFNGNHGFSLLAFYVRHSHAHREIYSSEKSEGNNDRSHFEKNHFFHFLNNLFMIVSTLLCYRVSTSRGKIPDFDEGSRVYRNIPEFLVMVPFFWKFIDFLVAIICL